MTLFVLSSDPVATRQEAQLAGVANAWDDVKDFKWLRAQRSPHWNVLPESERLAPEETEGLEGGATGGKERRPPPEEDDEDEI